MWLFFGGYVSLYYLHGLTLFFFEGGGKILNFFFFFWGGRGGGWNCSNYFVWVCEFVWLFLGGMSVCASILGISFQNIAFCKIFCDVFMKQMYHFHYFLHANSLCQLQCMY